MNKTTLDIVNRARELADLQNSDFIGWKENNSLLNEAYTKLYTELINHKDRYYIKIIGVSDLEFYKGGDNEAWYKLPDDFYMLNSISRGVNCEQILRKAPAESKTSYRYDIMQNCIVFYGGVDQTDLTIEYWPVPDTLSLKAPTKIISLPEGYKWLDVNNNKYLGYKNYGSHTEVILFNLKTNMSKTLTLETEEEIESGFYSDLYTIVSYTSNETKVYKILDFYNSEIIDLDNFDKIIIGKKDNKVYTLIYNNDAETWTLSDNYYSEVISFEEDLENIERFTFTEENGIKYFYFLSNGVVYDALLTPVFNGVLHYLDSYNNEVYYETIKGVFKDNKNILEKFKSYEFLLGVNKIDSNTGYGITVIDEDLQYKVLSAFEETIIEFPNNFYFQYLSYMLAISYKAKQNADSTALQQQATNESNQFYNSISQDVNQEVRIKNIYNMGGWY